MRRLERPFLLLMIKHEDEKWLQEVFNSCFKKANLNVSKEERLLPGFSLLIQQIAERMERILGETRQLWEQQPDAQELKDKFETLARCLICLRRYCREKIARQYPNG